jgi:hypothetical protein
VNNISQNVKVKQVKKTTIRTVEIIPQVKDYKLYTDAEFQAMMNKQYAECDIMMNNFLRLKS